MLEASSARVWLVAWNHSTSLNVARGLIPRAGRVPATARALVMVTLPKRSRRRCGANWRARTSRASLRKCVLHCIEHFGHEGYSPFRASRPRGMRGLRRLYLC